MLARGLHPMAKVGQQCCSILLEPIGEKEGHAARGEHRYDLMDQALRHGQGLLAYVDRQQQFALRVDCRPEPMGRALLHQIATLIPLAVGASTIRTGEKR
jgi:hypothetical protein